MPFAPSLGPKNALLKLGLGLCRGEPALIVLSAALLSACLMSEPGEAGDDPEVASLARALATPPDLLCVGASNNGHDYWICPSLRSWSQARSRCLAIGYDLAAIESSAENQFLLSRVPTNSWLAATDASTEGA